MKINLRDLLLDIEVIEQKGSLDVSISEIVFDSRKVKKDSLFVAQKGTQVICVTHSPQIAAVSDAHLFVSKTESEGRTHSSVRALTEEEHINEVARIIGGAKITEQTLAAAKELCASEDN